MKTSHSLPWDPIIFSWNQWLQKYIVFQLTNKCYFYLWFPPPNLSLLGRDCGLNLSLSSCLLGLLSHYLLQTANYLEEATREGIGRLPSPLPTAREGEGTSHSSQALSKHNPSVRECLRVTREAVCAGLLCRCSGRRITGNASSQRLQSYRGLSWDLSSVLNQLCGLAQL